MVKLQVRKGLRNVHDNLIMLMLSLIASNGITTAPPATGSSAGDFSPDLESTFVL